MTVKLCPTIAGYSPDAPLPTFDCWRPFVLPKRREKLEPQQGGRRKWPMLEVGQVLGCYEVIGLSRGRLGRADLDVRVLCECGVTEQVFEFNLRKRLTRSDKCPHKQEG